MKNIVCLGGITLDKIVKVDKIPRKDGSALAKNKPALSLGGRGCVSAIALGMLGADVSLFATVGYDFTKGHKLFLRRQYVNLDGLVYCPLETSFHSTILVAGKDARTVFEFKELEFKVNREHKRLMDRSQIVYLTSNQLDFNYICMDYAFRKGKEIIHNLPSIFIEERSYLLDALNRSNILILNEEDYDCLCHKQGDKDHIFKKFSNVRNLIVTLGRKGSVIYSPNGSAVEIDAVSAETVDVPVGLGDAFSAGIVFGEANYWNLEKSARLGSHLAAASMESRFAYMEKEFFDRYMSRFNQEFPK